MLNLTNSSLNYVRILPIYTNYPSFFTVRVETEGYFPVLPLLLLHAQSHDLTYLKCFKKGKEVIYIPLRRIELKVNAL